MASTAYGQLPQAEELALQERLRARRLVVPDQAEIDYDYEGGCEMGCDDHWFYN